MVGQNDCPGRHWERWRQAPTSPVTTRAVTLTTFPFMWYWTTIPVGSRNEWAAAVMHASDQSRDIGLPMPSQWPSQRCGRAKMPPGFIFQSTRCQVKKVFQQVYTRHGNVFSDGNVCYLWRWRILLTVMNQYLLSKRWNSLSFTERYRNVRPNICLSVWFLIWYPGSDKKFKWRLAGKNGCYCY